MQIKKRIKDYKESLIALKVMELEETGKYTFEEIVKKMEEYRDKMQTYFVLDNLDFLKKNGRLTGLKALAATTLNIKPVLKAIDGEIAQAGQAVGVKKALAEGKISQERYDDYVMFYEQCKDKRRY